MSVSLYMTYEHYLAYIAYATENLRQLNAIGVDELGILHGYEPDCHFFVQFVTEASREVKDYLGIAQGLPSLEAAQWLAEQLGALYELECACLSN